MWCRGEPRLKFFQRFLGPTGARETSQANHPPSSYGNTQFNPTLHGPCGPGGVVHLRITDEDLQGRIIVTTRPKLVSTKKQTRIETWNLQAMCQARKFYRITKKTRGLNLAIPGISEARQLGSGKIQLVTRETLL